MIKTITLTQVELQQIKHIINSNDILYKKLNIYSSECVDPQIKQMFIKAAENLLLAKEKLLTFLKTEDR